MKTHLNLLPHRYELTCLVRRRLWQWAMVWGVALVCMALHGWVTWSQHHWRQTSLASLERDYAPVKRLQEDIQSNRQGLRALQQRESLVLELAEPRPVLTVIGCVSRAARETDGNVTVDSFQLKRIRDSHDPDAGEQSLLTLRGEGYDNISIARFAATLRASKVFDQVNLTSTEGAASGAAGVRRYNLECSY